MDGCASFMCELVRFTCPVTGCTDMANFKPAAGSHDVNLLFLAFLKKQNDTSGIGPKDIETEPTSTEKKDGDTEKKITTFTMNLRGAETQGSCFYRCRF